MDEALKQRKALENKLNAVHASLEGIKWEEYKYPGTTASSPQRTLLNYSDIASEDRKKKNEIFLKRQSEAEHFSTKMKKLQKNLRLRETERYQDLMNKIRVQLREDDQMLKERAQSLIQKREVDRKKITEKYGESKKQRNTLLERISSKNRGREKNEAQTAKSHCQSIEGSPRSNYLYQKNIEKEKHEMYMELAKRKDSLKMRRNLYYKPIKEMGIEEHRNKYEDIVEQKENERFQGKQKRMQEFAENGAKVQEFKTHGIEKLLTTEKELQIIAEKEKQIHDDHRKITKIYSNQVQEEYKPKISKVKMQELEAVKQNLQTKPRKALDNWEIYKNFERSVFSVNTDKQGVNRTGTDTEFEKGNRKNKKSAGSSKYLNSSGYIPPMSSERELRTDNQVDYLQQLRVSREHKEEKARRLGYPSSTTQTIEQLLRNDRLPYLEKVRQVKGQAEVLEMKAKRKELLMKTSKRSTDLNLGQEVSDLFIDSIKAKLSLLEQM